MIENKSKCNQENIIHSNKNLCDIILKKISQISNILDSNTSQIYNYIQLCRQILTLNTNNKVQTNNLTHFSNTKWINNQTILHIFSNYLQSFQNGLSQCHLSAPFFNDYQCIKCPQSMVFSLITKECQNCHFKQYYNSNLHICSQFQTIYISRPDVLRITGQNVPQYFDIQSRILREIPYSQICPLHKPFSLKYSCIQCQRPNDIFNITTLECTSCPKPAYFNESIYNCEGYPNVTNKNYLKKILGGKYLSNSQQDIECLPQKPFFTGTQCIACQFIYNDKKKQCTKCERKHYFSQQTQFCQNSPQNKSNPIVQPRINNYLPIDQDFDIACPIQNPFFNGQQCIDCQKPAFFFNQTNLQCYTPDSNGSNPLQKKRIINGKLQQNENNIYCLKKKPFYNGQQCIDCIFPLSLFDLQKLQCVSPPPNATNPIQQARIFGELPQQKYLIFCKQQKPFFDGQQCINCFHPNSYFNISLNECQPGFPNMTNPEYLFLVVEKIIQPNYDYDYFCPNEKPYFAQQACINCQFPYSLYNALKLQCQKLPYNGSNPMVYDRIVGGQEKNNQYTVRCLIENPFFNGQQCIFCEQLFNITTYTCQKYPSNITNSLFLKKTNNPLFMLNYTKYDIQCPILKPFYKPQQDQCIECNNQIQFFFNLTTYECQYCGTLQYFNTTKLKCVSSIKKLSNLQTQKKWMSNYPFKQKVQYKQRKLNSIICPLQFPFYDGSQCIICEDNSNFNIDLSICQHCKQGYSYKTEFKKCTSNIPLYYSNLENGRYSYSGISEGQWKAQYNNQKQINNNIKICPQQKPYYDGQKCKDCMTKFGVFDLLTKDCIYCEEGTKYNELSKQCLSLNQYSQSEKANFEKLAATIFSHKTYRHKLNKNK